MRYGDSFEDWGKHQKSNVENRLRSNQAKVGKCSHCIGGWSYQGEEQQRKNNERSEERLMKNEKQQEREKYFRWLCCVLSKIMWNNLSLSPSGIINSYTDKV